MTSKIKCQNEFPNFDETFIFLSKYFFPTWTFVYFIQEVTAWVMEIHTPVLRRGHVAYFSCLNLSLSLSHSAFAMFIL